MSFSSNNELISAVVVSYFPDFGVLLALLRCLALQVDHLILVDNGGGQMASDFFAKEGGEIQYVRMPKNMGLGFALNAGFEQAANFGSQYVATFDQDSAPAPHLIAHLRQIHRNMKSRGVLCAAVGPAFYDRREAEKNFFPFYLEDDIGITALFPNESTKILVQADSLITSGMLVDISVWLGGIRYQDDLFVDYTDTDWCFRARAKGYQLFGALDVEMGHALSDGPPVRFLGFNFFKYSPLRRYYYFRNTVALCHAPYVSKAWKRRLASGLVLRFFINLVIDRQRFSSAKMMLKGIRHAVAEKSGEYAG